MVPALMTKGLEKMMRTEEEFRELEGALRRTEKEKQLLRITLLDQFAQAALASGRCSPMQCYDWAETALEERKNYVR